MNLNESLLGEVLSEESTNCGFDAKDGLVGSSL